MLKVFGSPSRYVQGPGATAALAEQMSAQGLSGPAFILASQRVQTLLAPTWQDSFAAAGLQFEAFTFGGECCDAEIDAGTAAARELGAGTVVGVGGGKALDTARAVAANLDLPVVNCPTLASSDAPCSALSVVYTADGRFERINYYRRNPDLVLVDTQLVAGAPRRFLVSGMGDALATWFEARTVVEAHATNALHGGSSMTAAGLARLCYDTLLADGVAAAASVEAGATSPALERIVEANTLLSGLGFESGGLALAHSVHNGLTALPPTHAYLHGEKVAFGLLVQLVAEGRASAEIDEVIAFSRSVGLPTCLADIGLTGLTDEQVQQVAERTVAPGESAHNEPFEVTPELVGNAILAADRLGAAGG